MLFAGTALAASQVKILQTWTGHMPVSVPPLLESSVASKEQWRNVWATCQMKGAAPVIDFDKHLVLVAVRQSTTVRFNDLKLDNGNLMTGVIATPDAATRRTCALAMVSRAGVQKVNGGEPGR